MRKLPPKTANPDAPLLVTVTRAAELLGVSKRYVYGLCATGDLDSVALGGKKVRRIKYESLLAYVERQPSEPAA